MDSIGTIIRKAIHKLAPEPGDRRTYLWCAQCDKQTHVLHMHWCRRGAICPDCKKRFERDIERGMYSREDIGL